MARRKTTHTPILEPQTLVESLALMLLTMIPLKRKRFLKPEEITLIKIAQKRTLASPLDYPQDLK